MLITTYMNEHFPTIQLIPDLCSQTEHSLHITLGEDIYQFTKSGALNIRRFQVVYEQVTNFFHGLLEVDDDMFFVTNVYKKKGDKPSNVKVYRPHIRDKNMLCYLRVQTLPYPFEYDGEHTYEMQQFSLRRKSTDIRIGNLLKATIHEDFPLKPEFSKKLLHYPDVFIINATRHIIFFIYDDRGCKIVVKDAEMLRTLKGKYGFLHTN